MKFHLISNKGEKTAIIYTLIVLTLTLGLVAGTGIYSSSLSTCVSYLSNASYKWCRFLTTTIDGYYCPSSESSTYGNSNYDMRGSSDSYHMVANSKYLLCPTSSSIGNTQSYTLNSSDDSVTLSSNYFGTSNICWYRFLVNSSSVFSVKITINNLSYASASVYQDPSSNSSFYFNGYLSNGSSLNVSTGNYGSVWVLIIPTSSSAYASVYAKALNTSSNNTISKIPILTLFTILFWFIIGFTFILGITWLCLCIGTGAKGNRHPNPILQNNNVPYQEQQFYRQ